MHLSSRSLHCKVGEGTVNTRCKCCSVVTLHEIMKKTRLTSLVVEKVSFNSDPKILEMGEVLELVLET